MQRCALTIPTSVDDLELVQSEEATISRTENLTSLNTPRDSIKTSPCPKLQELQWYGETLSAMTLPCPISDMTTLSRMFVVVDNVDPAFVFPIQLMSLRLTVMGESFDVALLSPLTRLQQLDISLLINENPLDLSGLTTLTKLDAYRSPVSGLPTSLVECQVGLPSDTDLSPMTHLTALTVWLGQNTRVTFPTVLRNLTIKAGTLRNSNINDLDLSSFDADEHNYVDWKILQKVQKRT